MDNDELLVPHNSRIDQVQGRDSLSIKSTPLPPKCSPVSCPSQLSFSSPSPSSSSWQNGQSIAKTPIPEIVSIHKPSNEQKAVADILKRRLYDGAQDSDVYRRQVSILV